MTPAESAAIDALHFAACERLGLHPEGVEGRALLGRIRSAYCGAIGLDRATGVVPLPHSTVTVLKNAGK